MENIFVEILLPKTKPLVVGIICRPPNQSNCLEIVKTNFGKLDTDMKESYIVRGDRIISSKFLSDDIKKYHQFCTMHGLKYLIKPPTRLT